MALHKVARAYRNRDNDRCRFAIGNGFGHTRRMPFAKPGQCGSAAAFEHLIAFAVYNVTGRTNALPKQPCLEIKDTGIHSPTWLLEPYFELPYVTEPRLLLGTVPTQAHATRNPGIGNGLCDESGGVLVRPWKTDHPDHRTHAVALQLRSDT